jgi:hypothetical protein
MESVKMVVVTYSAPVSNVTYTLKARGNPGFFYACDLLPS